MSETGMTTTSSMTSTRAAPGSPVAWLVRTSVELTATSWVGEVGGSRRRGGIAPVGALVASPVAVRRSAAAGPTASSATRRVRPPPHPKYRGRGGLFQAPGCAPYSLAARGEESRALDTEKRVAVATGRYPKRSDT